MLYILIFRSCVKFYSAADEIGASALKEHCSGLISAHWDDLTGMAIIFHQLCCFDGFKIQN